MNPVDIIEKYYEPGTRLHRILIHHGSLVAQKALQIAWKLSHLEIDPAFLKEAAMLHADLLQCNFKKRAISEHYKGSERLWHYLLCSGG